MTFGEKFKAEREKRKLTQLALKAVDLRIQINANTEVALTDAFPLPLRRNPKNRRMHHAGARNRSSISS